MRAGAAWLLAACMVGCGASDEAQPPGDVVDDFHRALRSGDTALVLSLLDRDAVVYELGEHDASREAYAATHLANDMAFARETRRHVLERHGSSSGELHWLLTRYRITGSVEGVAVDDMSVETVLLRRAGSGWRILHIHWSARPAAG